MTWVLLLIQLLPSVIDIVVKIMEAIKKKPLAERSGLRKEFGLVCKGQLKKLKAKGSYGLRHDEGSVMAELEGFLDEVA